MRVALAQIDSIIGDFEGISRAHRAAWERARDAGAQLLVLPELATTGYPPRDLLSRRRFVQASVEALEQMASWTASGPAILAGAAVPNPGPGNDLHNSAALLSAGALVGRAIKTLLPTYDVFDEHRYFEPATARAPLPLLGRSLGVTVCEDIWVGATPTAWSQTRYDVDPCAELADAGADLFVNVSASPFALGKAQRRRALVAERARRHRRWMIYVNQVGAHDELIFDGHSLVVDPSGEVALRLADFRDDFATFDLPDAHAPEVRAPSRPAVAGDDVLSEPEEAYGALTLGLRDYVRKSGFDRVVLGLSGGVDSALTAALAADALGPERVWGVAMPTRYSSPHSLEDAAALAAKLGVRYDVVPIDGTYQAALDQLEPLLAGRPFGLAQENLQARLRGVTLMALSNEFGHLLLSTSNKSESAVGYTTLYGDMSGALAVIADLNKTRVYALCRWLNRDRERIPERTLTKPPSAELRPDQTDQDSLPPYDVVDAVIEAYVERGLGAEDVVASVAAPAEAIARLIGLIDRSEYKRRQAPPVLRVTDKAFGPGRRIPIVARHLAPPPGWTRRADEAASR